MGIYLNLTVRFLTDRYHGLEWPPSPARLFKALVAGARTGKPALEWNPRWEAALIWLEGLRAPSIEARHKTDGSRYTMFVPNNSLDGSVNTRTAKEVAPKILVEHSPGEPDVVYRWELPDEEKAKEHTSALDELCARLRTLGWGIDFAAASARMERELEQHPAMERFTPDQAGSARLSVPVAGSLADLERSHEKFLKRISPRGIDPYTRAIHFGEARYRGGWSPQRRRWIGFQLEGLGGAPFGKDWEQVQTVAAWLRHAAGAVLANEELEQSWIDSYVLGHTTDTDIGRRLSFLPLPSIGHRHSDGRVRRVVLTEPPGVSQADREALDLLKVKLSGFTLTDEGGVARAVLVPLEPGDWVTRLYTLRASRWETVTPVVLHGHNASRGRISVAKTERLLQQTFEAAGIPANLIANLSFQSAPFWPGSNAAAAIRVPRHLERWPRLHVQVRFREAVEGPVIAGIGRHYGIGLFAARQEK